MRATGIIWVGMAGLVSACVAPTVSDAPAMTSVAPASVPVTLGEAALTADLRPGPDGTMLTRSGAAPARGLTVAVRPLGMDQGKLAKAAAQSACEGQGGRFNPMATGRFAGGGAWEFRGACA